MIDDSEYEIDSAGNRVLIGLSLEETTEYLRLGEIVTTQTSDEDNALRWLELYEKHFAALRPFCYVGTIKH